MNKAEPIHVPFTKAGERAFEVIHQVAIKLHDRATSETAEFIAANFPQSKTISEDYDNGKYLRTILSKGTTHMVTYNYRTKEIEVLNEKGAENEARKIM